MAPRVNIPIQEIPLHGVSFDDIVWTVADDANDHDFVNSGKEVVLMKNDSGGSLTADVISVDDEFGRTGDETMTTGASDVSIAGPFPPQNWNSEAGKAYIDLTDDTSVFFAVVKFLGL